MVIVAVNNIFLVRHGLINYDTQELNEKGKSFSFKLIDIFKNIDIEYILYENVDRCKYTILPLIQAKNIQNDYYIKDGFDFSKKFDKLRDFNTILICYCKESIRNLQKELRLDPSTFHKTDACYKYILNVIKNNNNEWSLEKKIKTGFEKG
jgi:hypothetical protein